MEPQAKKELARRIIEMCDSGYANVYELAELLSQLTGSQRTASCNCASVAGRFCREARAINDTL